MKIISWNLNGIRAVEKKGELQKLFKNFPAQIYLFQETKIDPENFLLFQNLYPDFWQFGNFAEKKGYSGTAIFCQKSFFKNQKINFQKTYQQNINFEGRVCNISFGDWEIFSTYFPNGGKSEQAWQGKLQFYQDFLAEICERRKNGKKIIFGGDINCAAEEIDLARPKQNDGKIGFHPEERKRLQKFKKENWIDIFRKFFPQKQIFSWWDLKSRARERNVGWRIDYFFCDAEIFPKVKKIKYLQQQFGSDHCPIFLQLESK